MLAERGSYLARVPALRRRPVSQIHLGGGTPTFMPPAVLEALLEGIAARLPLRADGYEGSVEVDPRVTTREHLDVMRANGLSRISLGVQDVDAEVLRLVNRPQPLAITADLCRLARESGYESINFDLIQVARASQTMTARRCRCRLRPDRLAVYKRVCHGSARPSASSRTRIFPPAPRSAAV